MKKEKEVIWRPQKIQKKLLESAHDEILFGGAKGGGKTDVLLFDAIKYISEPGYKALIIRRTYPRLREIINRSMVFRRLGGVYKSSEKVWRFQSGSQLFFGHCQNEGDELNYQGHQYHYIGFDQVEEFTENMFNVIAACGRKVDDIPVRIRCTANPGGIGQYWVKRRWIEGKEPGRTYFTEQEVQGKVIRRSMKFIPSNIYDNEILMRKNPEYMAFLLNLPEKFRRMYLEGDFNVEEEPDRLITYEMLIKSRIVHSPQSIVHSQKADSPKSLKESFSPKSFSPRADSPKSKVQGPKSEGQESGEGQGPKSESRQSDSRQSIVHSPTLLRRARVHSLKEEGNWTIKEGEEEVFLGVDVARFGDDSTVIAFVEGNTLTRFECYNKLDINQVAQIILRKIREDHIKPENIGIDTVGLGGGVHDIIKSNGYRVKGLVSSGYALVMNGENYRFRNLRCQMQWYFRELLREGKLFIGADDREFEEEALAVKYEISSEGMIMVEHKEEIKKRIGRSTNKFDAAVYAAFVPIMKNRMRPHVY